MMKLSISILVFSLSVVSLIGLNGCNRQDSPPDAVKELLQVPGTAIGGMPGVRSTRPRELRQCWKRQAIGQPRPVRKGRRKLEM